MTTPATPDRQPAYDAVFEVIRRTPTRSTDSYGQAAENARVWRAVEAALDAMQTAGRLLPADRVADAVLVRHAAEADIARQVLMLAEDPKILAMWADTCDPRPVTVADHFRALAEKLSRPTTAEVQS